MRYIQVIDLESLADQKTSYYSSEDMRSELEFNWHVDYQRFSQITWLILMEAIERKRYISFSLITMRSVIFKGVTYETL